MDFDELEKMYKDFREFMGSWLYSEGSQTYCRMMNDEIVEEINELEFEALIDEFRQVEKEYFKARVLRSVDI